MLTWKNWYNGSAMLSMASSCQLFSSCQYSVMRVFDGTGGVLNFLSCELFADHSPA